jgi:very-short-patch-repair endonuclease
LGGNISDGTHPDSADERIATVGQRQHGVFSLAQAREAGLNRSAVDYRVRRGKLVRVHPEVYRIKGAPNSWEQALHAALLWAGPEAVVSHRSAGALWKLDRVRRSETPELLIPWTKTWPCTGVTLHRTRDLSSKDVSRVAGFPVTSLPRTLIDLASVISPRDLEAALESALRRRLEIGWLIRRLRALGSKGRQGTGQLARFIEERVDVREFLDGSLEVNLLRALRNARLPEPARHFDLFDDDLFVGEIDFAYPEQRLALEGDGYSTHGGYRAFEEDRARASALAAAGWRLLRFTWGDVRDRPRYVADLVRRALEQPTARAS